MDDNTEHILEGGNLREESCHTIARLRSLCVAFTARADTELARRADCAYDVGDIVDVKIRGVVTMVRDSGDLVVELAEDLDEDEGLMYTVSLDAIIPRPTSD